MSVMAQTGVQRYRQELAAHPQALGTIRRIVNAYLRFWGFEQLAEPAMLCVSEVLSNVQKHTDSARCVLTLEHRPGTVRLIVSDTSTKLPVVRHPDWIAESGRGMVVVHELADAWGAVPTDTGKDVWIEFHTAHETVAE